MHPLGITSAVDGDLEGGAPVEHAVVAQPAKALHEYAIGHALHRIEIDPAASRDSTAPDSADPR
jgi:hypothetical protein